MTVPDDAAPAGGPRHPAESRAAAQIEEALASLGLTPERPRPGSYLVRLPGQHKLATMTWLIVGRHSVGVEAFFCRRPDENHDRFYRFLLERNGRMYGVHFALDPLGDVYLVGRMALAAVSAAEIDRVLGCVLTYSDENFDRALAIGFTSAIRREWAWRVRRGESLANLRPFARLAGPGPEPGAPAAIGPEPGAPEPGAPEPGAPEPGAPEPNGPAPPPQAGRPRPDGPPPPRPG